MYGASSQRHSDQTDAADTAAQGVELCEFVRIQPKCSRIEVLVQPGPFARTWNRHNAEPVHLSATMHPRESHLRSRDAAPPCKALDHRHELRIVGCVIGGEPGKVAPDIVLRQRTVLHGAVSMPCRAAHKARTRCRARRPQARPDLRRRGKTATIPTGSRQSDGWRAPHEVRRRSLPTGQGGAPSPPSPGPPSRRWNLRAERLGYTGAYSRDRSSRSPGAAMTRPRHAQCSPAVVDGVAAIAARREAEPGRDGQSVPVRAHEWGDEFFIAAMAVHIGGIE